MSHKLIIIHHTHWDREWHRSFSDFRYRLLKASKYLLTLMDPDQNDPIPCFLFDGQTIMMEDLKEITESQTYERLKSLIASRRIAIGPWYTMPDEFLIHPEALIRNLEIGMEQSQRLGAHPEVLYLPDTFGHISQLPQIAAMFGLTSIVVGRGINIPMTDVLWEGPDGTQVHCHAFPLWTGYYQDLLHRDEYVAETKKFIQESLPSAGKSSIVLMDGTDHTMPVSDWATRRRAIAEALVDWEGGWELEELSLNQAMSLQRNQKLLPVLKGGELRDNSKSFLLSSISSSRVDLKLLNVRAQNTLIHQLEPMTLFAFEEDREYYHRKTLWKQLIQNHAHDSIGGCSIDEVHRENTCRFESVIAGAKRHVQNICRKLAHWEPQQHNLTLTLWNTLPWDMKVVEKITIFIPDAVDKSSLSLEENSVPLEMAILDRKRSEGFYSEFEYPVNWVPGWEYLIMVAVYYHGYQAKNIEIIPCEPSAVAHSRVQMSNEALQVEFAHEGNFHVQDNRGSNICSGISLVWEQESGDAYTTSPDFDSAFTGKCISQSPLKAHPLGQRCTLNFRGPQCCTVELTLELNRYEDFLRMKLQVRNHPPNHRLRMLFDAGQEVWNSRADIPWDIVERTHKNERFTAPFLQKESYPNEWPSTSMMCMNRLMIMHKGLHGYDIEAGKYLALNIVRSVSFFSEKILLERGGQAGPHIATKDSQISTVDTEIAVAMATEGKEVKTTKRFLRESLYHQGNGCKDTKSFLHLDNPHLIMEASYMNATHKTVLRLWNTTNHRQNAVLTFPGPIKGSSQDNEPKSDGQNHWLLEFRPKQIITLEGTPHKLAEKGM